MFEYVVRFPNKYYVFEKNTVTPKYKSVAQNTKSVQKKTNVFLKNTKSTQKKRKMFLKNTKSIQKKRKTFLEKTKLTPKYKLITPKHKVDTTSPKGLRNTVIITVYFN